MTLSAIFQGTSAVLGIFGANQQNASAEAAAEAQHQQALKLYDHDWAMTLRSHDFAVADLGVRIENDNNVKAYREANAIQKWNTQMEIREYEHKNRVDAFNRSEDIFEQQIQVNTFSSMLAHDEANRFFEEQQIANNFAKEGLARDLFKALDNSDFAKAEIELNKHTSIQGAATKRREAELQYQSKRKELGFKSQSNMIEQLQNEGKAKSRGTGRSAGKSIQSAMMLAGMQQTQIVENIADSKQQFKIASTAINQNMMAEINAGVLKTANLENVMEYKRQEHNQGLRELQASMDSARYNLNSTRMKINLDKQVADLRANANRMLEPTIGPEIPRPIKEPEINYLEPLDPVKGPKPVKGAPQTISAFTTMANALSNLADFDFSTPSSPKPKN